MSRIQFAALAFLTTIVTGLFVVLGVQVARRLSARTIRLIGCGVFAIYGALCLVQPRAWLISDMIVILVAVFAGRLVAGGLRSKVRIPDDCERSFRRMVNTHSGAS